MSASRATAPVEVLGQIAEIARRVAGEETLDETLQATVDLCEEYVGPADSVSLMFVRGREITTPAWSSSLSRDSDRAQYEADQGPCLAALRQAETVLIDDLPQDDRWPGYRDRAVELGVRSVLSLQLFVQGDTYGALNVHARQPHVFDEVTQAFARIFASHAAVALKGAITESGLRTALASRDVIGQAKGILMEREGCSAQAAFDRLRGLSQALNRPVRDLAQHIADTGEVPDPS